MHPSFQIVAARVDFQSLLDTLAMRPSQTIPTFSRSCKFAEDGDFGAPEPKLMDSTAGANSAVARPWGKNTRRSVGAFKMFCEWHTAANANHSAAQWGADEPRHIYLAG